MNDRLNKDINEEDQFVGVVGCNRHTEMFLYSPDILKLDQAEHALKNKVIEQTVPVKDGMLLDTDVVKLQKQLDKLHVSKSNTYKTIVSKREVKIAALESELANVVTAVSWFLADYKVISRFVALESGEMEYLQNFRKQSLLKLVKEHSEVYVELIDDPLRKGFVVRGQKGKCREFIDRLQVVTSDVSRMTLSVESPDVVNYIQSEQGKTLLEEVQLQQKAHCVVKLCTRTTDTELSSTYLLDTKRAECTISKFVVSLHVGCVASLKGDLLVNPSSEDFEHNSGISGVIVDKGRRNSIFRFTFS